VPTTLSTPSETKFSRRLLPDTLLLFRFSALSWNSHRIHYDADYARNVEGYPHVLVHGPLTFSLLAHLLQLRFPNAPELVKSWDYRAVGPLLAAREMTVQGELAADGLSCKMTALDAQLRPAMVGNVSFSRHVRL
jgi:3-methylfumaryl-CoA hydratase